VTTRPRGTTESTALRPLSAVAAVVAGSAQKLAQPFRPRSRQSRSPESPSSLPSESHFDSYVAATAASGPTAGAVAERVPSDDGPAEGEQASPSQPATTEFHDVEPTDAEEDDDASDDDGGLYVQKSFSHDDLTYGRLAADADSLPPPVPPKDPRRSSTSLEALATMAEPSSEAEAKPAESANASANAVATAGRRRSRSVDDYADAALKPLPPAPLLPKTDGWATDAAVASRALMHNNGSILPALAPQDRRSLREQTTGT